MAFRSWKKVWVAPCFQPQRKAFFNAKRAPQREKFVGSGLVSQFGAGQWAAAAPEVTLGDLMGEQKYDMLLAELQRSYAEHEPPAPGSGQYLAYARFRANLTARRRILAALKVAFWATAAVILLSVLLLCFAHMFYDCTRLARVMLAVGVASVAGCLWLYWRLISAALWNS